MTFCQAEQHLTAAEEKWGGYMNIEGKNQWYDGFFYNLFFDSIEGGNRKMILDLIPQGSTALDVCCGTGRLAFEMAQKCRHVTGVDISPRMLAFAEKQKNRQGVGNIDFVFGDATRLEETLDRHYDVAVVSLSLHEMDSEERHATVRSMASVADRLILADHTAPPPATVAGFMINQIERFFGGREVFPLYREFVATGGIVGALERCGLVLDEQRQDRMGIRHVVSAPTHHRSRP